MKKTLKKVISLLTAAALSVVLCVTAFATSTTEQILNAGMEYLIKNEPHFIQDEKDIENGIENCWYIASNYNIFKIFANTPDGKKAIKNVDINDIETFDTFVSQAGEWIQTSENKQKYCFEVYDNGNKIILNNEEVKMTNDGTNWYAKNKLGKIVVKFPVLKQFRYLDKQMNNDTNSSEETSSSDLTSSSTAEKQGHGASGVDGDNPPVTPDIVSRVDESRTERAASGVNEPERAASGRTENSVQENETSSEADNSEEDKKEESNTNIVLIVIICVLAIALAVTIVLFVRKK